jgi:chemotaxis protein histidine kinase CheA
MNVFKKIWTAVVEFFPTRQITDEKIISTVEKVWGNSEEKDAVVEIIQSIDDKQDKAKIIATINQIEKEIKTLEEKKEKINERLAKIVEIEIPSNVTEINESLNKIKQIVETKTTQTGTRFFLSDHQKLDNLLKTNNLVKQFKEREEARKKKEKEKQKQIRVKLDNIERLIGQDKLEEAKLLIVQIQKEINKSYKNELGRLSKAQEKLKDKELQILKRQQEETQRKRDEEAKRLREIEEKRQEEKRKKRELREKEEWERTQTELKKQKEKEERERQARAELEKLLVKKHNWQEFQQVLQQNGITTLYHFTDRANIKSIKENGGLYSWHYCDRKGIKIPYQGGGALSRDLDMRYNLQDYVRASFTRNHPMRFVAENEGRIQNAVNLEISLEVCYFQETRFANMNATKTGHSQGENLVNLQNIHFGTVKQPNHFDLDESEKPYFQAEVLVKTWIPIEYITNINNF